MAGDYIPMSVGLQKRRETPIIARESGFSIKETVGALYEFWCWAQDETPDGKLPGLTVEDLASTLAIDRRFFTALMRRDVDWLGEKDGCLFIPRFTRWMGKGAKARLKECEKKRRQRGRKSPRTRPDPVPPLSPKGGDNSGTTTGPQESTGEESKKKSRRARSSAFPDDFILTPERAEYAKKLAVEPVSEFEHFRDHHVAKGTVFRDWDAAWRNWVRNAAKFATADGRKAGGRRRELPPSTSNDLPRIWSCRRCGKMHETKAGERRACNGIDWRESGDGKPELGAA